MELGVQQMKKWEWVKPHSCDVEPSNPRKGEVPDFNEGNLREAEHTTQRERGWEL